MANIKLKDHYWETEGVYDAALSKTQKAINADIAEVAQNNSDLIIMSSTQPTATGNKIWIKEGVSYQIPVMDDLISNNITNNSSVTGAKVTDALNTLGGNVSSLQTQINHKADIYAITTTSSTGVPTDEEIISSIALGASNSEFIARFLLENGAVAFTIIWTKIGTNYASGLGFGYYEDGGYSLIKYRYGNGSLTRVNFYTNITSLQSSVTALSNSLNNPETIALSASAMTFDSGLSLYNADENIIVRIGKLCLLSISIKLEGITGSGVKAITNFFPSGWMPKSTYRIPVETGLGDGKLQPITVSPTGVLRIFPVNTGTTYAIGSGIYLCE